MGNFSRISATLSKFLSFLTYLNQHSIEIWVDHFSQQSRLIAAPEIRQRNKSQSLAAEGAKLCLKPKREAKKKQKMDESSEQKKKESQINHRETNRENQEDKEERRKEINRERETKVQKNSKYPPR